MKGHIIIGGTGRGKTTFVKKMLSHIAPERIEIYDVNKEYEDFYKQSFLEFEDFMLKVKPLKNKFIVFEEATIFFNNRGCDKILVDMLVRKRHTNNYIILNFHSIRNVPRYVWDLCNIVTLFKTNDSEKKINDYFDLEEFVNTFYQVKDSPDFHCNKTLKLY
jgi:hypothetical protein